jgi:hypothetical protein
VDEREYNSKASAMTYAMMKRDFMKVGESIFVMNDDGDVLYTSIGTKKMAMGGKFPYQNAQVGDNARVILDNKMGTIIVAYGRRFHLKFPDGTEKTYSAEELEFFPTDEMMADGGEIGSGKNGYVAFYKGKKVDVKADTMYGAQKTAAKYFNAKKEYDVNVVLAEVDGKQYVQSTAFAKGGYMAKDENYEYVNTFNYYDSNVRVPQDDFEKLIDAYHKQLSGDKLDVAKYNVLKIQMGNYLGHKTVEKMEEYIEKTHNAHKMAKGGYVSKRDVEAITIINPNKSDSAKKYLTFKSGEFLNGLNQFEKGGKLIDNYTYIKRGDIFAVYYKDKTKKAYFQTTMEDKPKNGFWVSKKALIREGGKTPSKSSATFDAYESYDELSKLNGKIWDKLKIESGSQIYASDSLQKKLAIEYPNSGIDAKFKSLTAAQRKKVAEVMTDENEHSFRNYLTLRGYLGPKEYDSYERIFDPKSRYVLNPANFKNYTADKVKIGSILTTDTGVKVKVVEYNPQFGVKVIRTDKYAADKPSQYMKLKEFKGFEKMADGGSIGFEALSKKVASRYAGKNVKPKYQKEYGKTYDKAEAKEVGDKVAAKVYRMQQGKMASGGKIELPHQLDRYFTKPAGTIEVEISKLIPIRARKSGIENAEVYMKKAYDGEMSKRKPIEIYKTRNKKYRVNDGNSTFAVAKKNGWETIYAIVVPNPNVTKRAEKSTFAIAKEIRKAGESWSDAVKRVKENRK